MLFGPKGRALSFCEGNPMNTSKEEMADQSILLVDDDPGF